MRSALRAQVPASDWLNASQPGTDKNDMGQILNNSFGVLDCSTCNPMGTWKLKKP